MRTSVAISAGFLYSTVALASTAPQQGGSDSLQALLERYSAKARHGVVPLKNANNETLTSTESGLLESNVVVISAADAGHLNGKRSPYVILPHPPRPPLGGSLDSVAPRGSKDQRTSAPTATSAPVNPEGELSVVAPGRTTAYSSRD